MSQADESVWRQMLSVRREERAPLLLAMVSVFLLMAGYFILRPIRDQMGVAGGVDNLPWLFTATLLAMFAVNPLYATLVSRFPRLIVVAICYRVLMLCLAGFWIALVALPEASSLWTGRVFFVWVSVYNLFALSVFWALMADAWRGESSRRLYGIIAAGATLGAVAGGALTAGLVEIIGQPALLLVSLAMLEATVWCLRAFERRAPKAVGETTQAPVGGGALDGLRAALKSPYLLGICGYMLLYTVGSTFLYFLQAQVVDAMVDGRAAQTRWFAQVDLIVNTLTLVLQLFLTGRLMGRLGVGLTLAALPLVSLIGFAGLGLWPVLGAVVVFTVARRVSNFAFSRPAREALFVPLPREEKYKSKNLVDTVIYRTGDQLGAWTSGLVTWLGFGMAGLAWLAAPLSAVWLALALWLGRRYRGLQLKE
jgi:AAA family ATP:ADP antiporter